MLRQERAPRAVAIGALSLKGEAKFIIKTSSIIYTFYHYLVVSLILRLSTTYQLNEDILCLSANELIGLLAPTLKQSI